jgi:hypothetical protein
MKDEYEYETFRPAGLDLAMHCALATAGWLAGWLAALRCPGWLI